MGVGDGLVQKGQGMAVYGLLENISLLIGSLMKYIREKFRKGTVITEYVFCIFAIIVVV